MQFPGVASKLKTPAADLRTWCRPCSHDHPRHPARFIDRPLVTKASAPDDYTISIDDLIAGRIMMRAAAGIRREWLWSITGPVMTQAGLASSGIADDLQEARQAFREAFDQWLAWALDFNGKVWWHGPEVDRTC